MGFIARAWKGEERLWKVFWLAGYLVPLLILTIVYLAAVFIGDGESTAQKIDPLLLSVTGFYYTIWAVMVFRCATNVKEKSWSIAARIWAVLVVLRIVFEAMHNLNAVRQGS